MKYAITSRGCRGSKDSLYPLNQEFQKFLKELHSQEQRDLLISLCPALFKKEMSETDEDNRNSPGHRESEDSLYPLGADYGKERYQMLNRMEGTIEPDLAWIHVPQQFEIYYDNVNEDGDARFNLMDRFDGSWYDLQDHIRSMKKKGCYNIHAVSREG